MLKTKIKLLSEKAVIPTRAHEDDTGYDLSIIGIDKRIGDVFFFKTGIALQPEAGYYFDVVPRSSISKTDFILTNSIGVIDCSYSGEILVALRYVGKLDTTYKIEMAAEKLLVDKPKVCQLILRKRLDTNFEIVSDLNETVRGSGGFGSTDKI